jgi:hypothetical protein
MQFNEAEVRRALQYMHPNNQVFEIRIPHNGRTGQSGGYFNDVSKAIGELKQYVGLTAVYVTINDIEEQALARANNRLVSYLKPSTSDGDVARRKFIFIDIDPVRLSGVSSTKQELSKAVQCAKKIMGDFYFWPKPLFACSGNGVHLLYRCDMPNDPYTKNVFLRFLSKLSEDYSDIGVKIDTTTYNSSRVTRLYGTKATKGDDTPDRPHRLSFIVHEGDQDIVSRDMMLAYCGENGAVEKEKPKRVYIGYTELDRIAIDQLGRWVPFFFPAARRYNQGFRVTSTNLDRSLEEDLSIMPFGITDFGEADQPGEETEGKRTPTRVVADFVFRGDLNLAASALADRLGISSKGFKESRKVAEKNAKIIGVPKIGKVTDLMAKTFKPIDWFVEGMLSSGCFILAGDPKARKSFMAMQMCLAFRNGWNFLGESTKNIGCLFLGLEDNERRLKDRIQLLTQGQDDVNLDNFQYYCESDFPQGQEAISMLEQILDDYPNVKFVVVDTLEKVRDRSGSSYNVYAKDYKDTAYFTELAKRRDICVLIIHHTRKHSKANSDMDWMQEISGSQGMTAGVDGLMLIKPQNTGATSTDAVFYARGRDMPNDWAIPMRFDALSGGWVRSDESNIQNRALAFIARHKHVNVSELKIGLRLKAGEASNLLMELRAADLVRHMPGNMSRYVLSNNSEFVM